MRSSHQKEHVDISDQEDLRHFCDHVNGDYDFVPSLGYRCNLDNGEVRIWTDKDGSDYYEVYTNEDRMIGPYQHLEFEEQNERFTIYESGGSTTVVTEDGMSHNL